MARGYRGCPLGGMPGMMHNVHPASASPNRAYRVISGIVWFSKVFHEWRVYRAEAMIGVASPIPTIAPYGAGGTYFTDQLSLEGINDSAQFARRVALRLPDHDECQRYGCVIIGFDIPDISKVQIPPPTAGAALGITATGAREWLYQDKLELSPNMDIIYIDPAPTGPMYYYIPLD